jgi:hypothetical protein
MIKVKSVIDTDEAAHVCTIGQSIFRYTILRDYEFASQNTSLDLTHQLTVYNYYSQPFTSLLRLLPQLSVQ